MNSCSPQGRLAGEGNPAQADDLLIIEAAQDAFWINVAEALQQVLGDSCPRTGPRKTQTSCIDAVANGKRGLHSHKGYSPIFATGVQDCAC